MLFDLGVMLCGGSLRRWCWRSEEDMNAWLLAIAMPAQWRRRGVADPLPATPLRVDNRPALPARRSIPSC